MTPAQNLALDEALLAAVGSDPPASESLRIWEESDNTVIVGRSSKLANEVNVGQCEADGVPVLRRCSGGCAILAGPGCLMYSVVLNLRQRPELRVIDRAHAFVLDKVLTAVHSCGRPDAIKAGLSDLVIPIDGVPHKFSGNSLRIARDALLYHGTLLLDAGLLDADASDSPSATFDTKAIRRWLLTPPRQPSYRMNRDHSDFVTTVPINRHAIEDALRTAWNAIHTCDQWPKERFRKLTSEKYESAQWNHRH